MTSPKPLLLSPLRRTTQDARNFAILAYGKGTFADGTPHYDYANVVAWLLFNEADRISIKKDTNEHHEMVQLAWLCLVPNVTHYGEDDLRAEGFSDRVATELFRWVKRHSGVSIMDHVENAIADAATMAQYVILARISQDMTLMRSGFKFGPSEDYRIHGQAYERLDNHLTEQKATISRD